MMVVTDTSVILNLCFLKQESLLISLFEKVIAPEQVVREFQRLVSVDSRFHGLVFPSFVQRETPSEALPDLAHSARLHAGENAVLALALEQRAEAVLMDERAGRAAASALGLKTVGLLGILIRARQRDLVPAIAPLLDRLHNEARFWISSSLRDAMLRAAGEGD